MPHLFYKLKKNTTNVDYDYNFNRIATIVPHTFPSNLGNNYTCNFKNYTRLRLVQFLKLLVQLFPKVDSNVCDYLY